MDLTSHFTEDFKEDLIKMSLIYDIEEKETVYENNESKSELFS